MKLKSCPARISLISTLTCGEKEKKSFNHPKGFSGLAPSPRKHGVLRGSSFTKGCHSGLLGQCFPGFMTRPPALDYQGISYYFRVGSPTAAFSQAADWLYKDIHWRRSFNSEIITKHRLPLREKFCFPSEPEFVHLMVKRQVPAPYQ